MTSSRRKSLPEISLFVEEAVETTEEILAEVVAEEEEIVEEVTKEEVREEVVTEVKQPAPVINNPKPVVARAPSRRNTPRFSAQR
jgi:hypothetical protein